MIYKLLVFIYNKFFFLSGRLRALFWGLFFKKIGKNTTIGHLFIASSPNLISIGEDTNIGIRCILGAHGEGNIDIGNNVAIAPDVSIMASNHIYENGGGKKIPIKEQGIKGKPVKIEDDVWIGTKVVILAGVTIGKNCVIGAGSVVTKDIPSNSVVAGVPAKVIKRISN